MFEKALSDLGNRAAADRFDAGDGEKIGDEVMRGPGIGTGQRREHALIFRRPTGGGERELIEIVRQRPFPVEILDQAALPGRRQIERGDEGGKQPDVADADVRRGQAIKRGRFQPQRQHFGVGRRLVLPGEEFDAGLQKLGGQSLAVAKDGAEIAERGRLAGRRRLQIGARDRNGEVGPQAQFAPVRIAGEKHAPADILAGQVEERLRRLDDRRLDRGVAGAHIGGDELLRALVRAVHCHARHDGHIHAGVWLIVSMRDAQG